jgi:lysophospholipase L1-like esterase
MFSDDDSNHTLHELPPMPSRVPNGSTDGGTALRRYVRYAALGDSATLGVGDRMGDEWRGWARLLADAVGEDHDVSYCNLAVAGATASDVRRVQLEEALAHRPHIASLIVGVNDTMRSTWDPEQLRADLLHCAEQLSSGGALLLTARFHDHGRVFRLPGFLARPMGRRIDVLNAIYDEVHSTYGGLRLDLDQFPDVHTPGFWSTDRLHPSARGHHLLATKAAELLNAHGLEFSGPQLRPTGETSSGLSAVWPLVKVCAPWVGRRARDLGPWALRRTLERILREEQRDGRA